VGAPQLPAGVAPQPGGQVGSAPKGPLIVKTSAAMRERYARGALQVKATVLRAASRRGR